MTKLRKNSLDTRTYSEIWLSLSLEQKRALMPRILDALKISPDALETYRNERRNPDGLKQETLVKVLRRHLGIQTSTAYLFPNSPYAKQVRKEMGLV